MSSKVDFCDLNAMSKNTSMGKEERTVHLEAPYQSSIGGVYFGYFPAVTGEELASKTHGN